MTVLSSRKILQEKNIIDPDSVTALTLTHRALFDVSCLTEFKNLERLDLGFNNLTSLEGLKSCRNLKWLSVVQNKLQSLKGIEGLTKLTVLNAGKNKLKSMDEVKSLASLRALILNDNEISSVCKLDQMKDLNTLVLSRNPINTLGESLVKLKSITKLSLSNCRLQTVDSFLKSLELKELRLAHNEIMAVPGEFGHLVKLENLDMGNNLITNWSSIKELSSLVNLRNLNLQGNPIAENENLLKKVKKLLPNLHIFNARPIEKIVEKEAKEKVDDFFVEAGSKLGSRSETKVAHSMGNKNSSKAHPLSESIDNNLSNAGDLGSRSKRKELLDQQGADSSENTNISEKRTKKKLKLQQNDSRMSNDAGIPNVNPEEAMKSKHKKPKAIAKEPDVKLVSGVRGKQHDKKTRKKIKSEKVNNIDSAENPFMDLFEADAPGIYLGTSDEVGHKTDQDIDAMDGLATIPTKKKKKNCALDPAAIGLSQVDEIGLGGPSAWGD